MQFTFALNVFAIADLFRRLLLPLLVVIATLVVVLLIYVVLLRAVRELRFRSRQRIIAQHRPQVDALLRPVPPGDALTKLRLCPRRHRRTVGELLLGPLRVATGELVGHLAAAAAALDLVELWRADLGDRRWWVRTEAIRALGLLRHAPAFAAFVAALDDVHPEVRAAAIGALGALGDARAIPELVARLADESRHQRVRLIGALRAFGQPVTTALVTHARQHPGDTAVIVDTLGLIGGPAAIDDLLQWCGDPRSDVRAAALRGLGSIGLDDRAYYYALQALGDVDPDVRAMAARALGRSGRPDAAPYLDRHLTDQWGVAGQCANALRVLGAPGVSRLQARTADSGQAGDLARQMVWESHALTPPFPGR